LIFHIGKKGLKASARACPTHACSFSHVETGLMGGAPCPRQLIKVGEKPDFLGYVNAILFPVSEKPVFL